MTPSEIEELINELETRVDRLRALYEQYFMGIEKMEPQVPRKDVERRIQLIRREQIRNTALRFRFQMILQRYNTYQTYWLRICREIEEGTYKRDVLRAKAKFGEAATRQLPKWHRRRFWKKDGEKKSDAPAEGADAPGALEFDESELEDAFDSVVMTSKPPPVPNKAPPPVPSKAPPLPPGARATSGAAPPLPKPPTPPVPFQPGAAAAPPLPKPPTSPVPFKPTAPAAEPDAASAGATKEERMRELARRLAEKKAAQQSTAGGAAPPKPAEAPKSDAAARADAKPAAAAAAAKAERPSADGKKRDLSEERMRQLYTDLVETKRRQKESTATVTYEAMVKTLNESSAKLKEKHAGRSVDFEVTVKDGKTILRPVVK
ncbi:MAG: MXAN_5187 C-terminal domain-containing protein [Polyangiaceae bacterium]